jgi:hypothetical protein
LNFLDSALTQFFGGSVGVILLVAVNIDLSWVFRIVLLQDVEVLAETTMQFHVVNAANRCDFCTHSGAHLHPRVQFLAMEDENHELFVCGDFGVSDKKVAKLLFIVLWVLQNWLVDFDISRKRHVTGLLELFDSIKHSLFKLLNEAHVGMRLQIEAVKSEKASSVDKGIKVIIRRDVKLSNTQVEALALGVE